MTELRLAVAGKLPDGINQKLLGQAINLVGQTASERTTDDGRRAAVINLKLVDDARIQDLNKKYAGNDKPTDVLSFNYSEDGGQPVDGELGDIAISYQTAQRQAQEAGTTLETEVTLLLVHGCLHLLGHDHAEASELKRMDQLQAEIMKRLGLTYRNFQWDLSKA